MNFIIRPVEQKDARDLNRIRRQPGIMRHTHGMPSDRMDSSEKYLSSIDRNSFVFVAEVQDKVVGIAALDVSHNYRERHIGSVGIAVDVDYHGNGIGRALMNTLLDIADNFLKLVRVELEVTVNNTKAQKLYKSLDFEIEGTRKYCCITEGEYRDDYYMARYNLDK